MDKEGFSKTKNLVTQRFFAAKQLQFSIALLVVLALLGGIFLQTVSSALVTYFEFNPAAVGVLLIFGYAGLVVLLAIFFTYRLIGPFKRLEYEMKLITSGDLSKRLSIRSKDDLHIRNFTNYVNSLIARFEQMGKDYHNANSAVSKELEETLELLSKEKLSCEDVKKRIRALQKQVQSFKAKW